MGKITIQPGKDPGLKIPEFVCDKPLKTDIPPPYNLLVDAYKLIIICGRPQSGKTSHMISLFQDKRMLRKVWNNIILIAPDESLRSMKPKDNIFKDLDPAKRYTDLADIDIVREQVKIFAQMNENSCIIIDDQMAKLKIHAIERNLTDIVANRRHYKTSIFILSQLYERVPLRIRKLINVCIIQYKPSKRELELVFDELLEEHEKVALEVSKATFKKPFDFLIIDVPSQEIYSKYDRVIINRDAQEKSNDTIEDKEHTKVASKHSKPKR